ncbi:MAG: hypothetical protein QM811_30770 [Pirellulales bacterium]
MRRSFALVATLACALVVGLAVLQAAITPEQRQKVIATAVH